jgi:hypothetical protein
MNALICKLLLVLAVLRVQPRYVEPAPRLPMHYLIDGTTLPDGSVFRFIKGNRTKLKVWVENGEYHIATE